MLHFDLLRARNGVAAVFVANGFVFASWMSRIPAVQHLLELTPGELGLLLLAISVGSLSGLPAAGWLVQRWGAKTVVTAASTLVTIGAIVAAAGAELFGAAAIAAVGLVVLGFGIGAWDVAMNLEGADVERLIGRTIMPRFHAAYSLGTVAGAGTGVLATALGIDVLTHLVATAGVALGGAIFGARGFLDEPPQEEDSAGAGSVLRAWREPRTLFLGVMVLSLALTEGTANDWLAVALRDGYDLPDWGGPAGFAVFVTAMTIGRVVGPALLDRHGRVAVLWGTMTLAAVGVLLTVFAGSIGFAVLGVLLWGLGASLGFPVGMSAAADHPRDAAARVSVVSTIGYTAFLAGPPLLGFVADHIGTLDALLIVAILLVPSALVVPAARESRPGDAHGS